jgi:type II secretory pathway pseudopilin PulG
MTKRPVLRRDPRGIGKQGGTTMMEVMVATLVLSAGLLGLAAMQTGAIQTASGLATQQVIAQTLSAYNEARLASPNTSISGGKTTDSVTGYVTINGTLATLCASLWRGVPSISSGAASPGFFQNPNDNDFAYFNTFLSRYTPCGNNALTDYAEYWNRYGGFGTVTQEGKECDYIVPETHSITCTLATGDAITMQNLVWLR